MTPTNPAPAGRWLWPYCIVLGFYVALVLLLVAAGVPLSPAVAVVTLSAAATVAVVRLLKSS